MALIKGYPKGSNITILNTMYKYPSRLEDGSGFKEDFLNIVFKDNTTGLKQQATIYQPDYEYYEIKPEYVKDYNQLYIEKDKTVKHTAPFNALVRDIATLTDNTDFYYENIRTGNRRANNELHTHTRIMNSDMNIEDHYRFRFNKDYTNEVCALSKAYFDIEADTINMAGDFPELGECPINAVSLIFENQVYSLLLRDSSNPLIEEFEKGINRDLFVELQQFIIDNVGGPEKASKFGVDNLEFNFAFYDEEIRLIQDLFILINKKEPDFVLAWNMAFDIPYIIERLKVLGYNPADIMCHPDFPEKVAEYFIDEQHMNEYEARGDRYNISSYSTYIDQMIQFPSRRKGQAKYPNFKLDTIGEMISGVKKLDFSHITTNISKLPRLDYKTFVFYNIMDTIVQKTIETNTDDINFIFMKCLANNTRYDKGHRQTVYLANRFIKYLDEHGYVAGNNINKHNVAVPYEGALVGDPTKNSSMYKEKVDNVILNFVRNLDDFDFKSLYPSIDREFNMSPTTQIGKIIIPEPVHSKENPFNKEMYDRGGAFLEDYVSGNIIEFCSRWLGYANFMEWIEDLTYYITHKYGMSDPRYYNHAFTVLDDCKSMMAFSPVADNEVNHAFTVYPEEIDMRKYVNIANRVGGTL